jgi:hypothetical protein
MKFSRRAIRLKKSFSFYIRESFINRRRSILEQSSRNISNITNSDDNRSVFKRRSDFEKSVSDQSLVIAAERLRDGIGE